MSMTEFEKSKRKAAEKIYTLKRWELDNHFSAKVGQEVSEEVYNQMRDCCEPLRLPQDKAEWALQHLRIPVHGGFLMGEPVEVTNNDGSKTIKYLAFGMNDYGRGKPENHFYYLGVADKEPELDGVYYYMDCMNADINRMYPAETFETDLDAIKYGAEYEAVVIKYTFDNGEPITIETLYDPFKIFGE